MMENGNNSPSQPIQLIATAAFGLEAIVGRELKTMGYQSRTYQPGRLMIDADAAAICRTNLELRCAERVLICLGQFEAEDFGELFDQTKSLPWEAWIPPDGQFPVRGRSIKSQLSSVPACQRMIKKAVADRLLEAHEVDELPETGAEFRVEVALLNDMVTLSIDASGHGLHKRGYRPIAGKAPLRETLAAALVQLSFWKPGRPLIDPFCGTGTIPIEAAMIGRCIAPGLRREFLAESWNHDPCGLSSALWYEARQAATANILPELPEPIFGFDAHEGAIGLARRNAIAAGVAEDIHFQCLPFSELSSKRQYGCVITNPPYGRRVNASEGRVAARPRDESDDQPADVGEAGDSHDSNESSGNSRERGRRHLPIEELPPEVEELYRSMPFVLKRLPTWSHYVLTGVAAFEGIIGQTADRRRKLYNGRIECQYYQFHGPRPPRSPKPPEVRTGDIQPPTPPSAVEPAALLPSASDLPTTNASETNKLRTGGIQPPSTSESPTTNKPIEPAQATTPIAKEATQTPDIKSKPPASDSKPTSQTPAPKPKPKTTSAVFGGLKEDAARQSEEFSNRLKKRARHLRRWPGRGITCFRLYEKDIPEIPLVVDRYEDRLHISEFARPHDRTPVEHADWLDLMKRTAARTLEVAPEKVYVKFRDRQRGDSQYTKTNDREEKFVVQEAGLKFLVNLSDYVDTGLFLDHRITRGMVRDQSQGVKFLNLFGYTGSFSVYAAAGGAAETTTVDSSRTYLDWTSENLRLNGFDGKNHQTVKQDTLQYLRDLPPEVEFDLAVVDPPTFSNSKDRLSDWDVQRDHIDLLQKLMTHIRPGGTVYFSTNFRRFKLDMSRMSGWQVHEISRQTVPDDFRNRRIHRCWRLVADLAKAAE